jgi:coenzyme PQQ precursor peptide PqqA
LVISQWVGSHSILDNGLGLVEGGSTSPAAIFNLEVHMWTKPEYTEMRFGFEVTMYIFNR